MTVADLKQGKTVIFEAVSTGFYLSANKLYRYVQFERDIVPSAVLGEPTRIVDLPCAEWHEWSE